METRVDGFGLWRGWASEVGSRPPPGMGGEIVQVVVTSDKPCSGPDSISPSSSLEALLTVYSLSSPPTSFSPTEGSCFGFSNASSSPAPCLRSRQHIRHSQLGQV